MPLVIGSITISPSFIIAYAGGFVILCLYCIEKIDHPLGESDRLFHALAPRHLGPNATYRKLAGVYLLLMLIVYSCLTVLGPNILKVIEAGGADFVGFKESTAVNDAAKKIEDVFKKNPGDAPVWFPLAVVLALTGFSTNIKVLNKIEFLVRKSARRIAGIPTGIERLSREISSLQFDLQHPDDFHARLIKKHLQEALGEDVADVTRFYENEYPDHLREWVRLQVLTEIIERKKRGLRQDGIDPDVFENHAHLWNEKVAGVIAAIKQNPALMYLSSIDSDEIPDEQADALRDITDQIGDALATIHDFISVGVSRHQKDDDNLTKALAALGLNYQRLHHRDVVSAIIVANFTMFAAVFAFIYLYYGTPRLAVSWAFGAVLVHGTACWAAWSTWEYQVRRSIWRAMRIRRPTKIPAKQYLWVGGKAYLWTIPALYSWDAIGLLLTGGSPVIDLEKLVWIPVYSVTGCATAFWMAYNLDLTNRRPSASTGRLALQIGLQVLTTCLCTSGAHAILAPGQPIGNPEQLKVAITTGIAVLALSSIVITMTARQVRSPDP